MLLMYEFLVRIECDVDPKMTFGDIAKNAADIEMTLRSVNVKPELRSVTLKKDA